MREGGREGEKLWANPGESNKTTKHAEQLRAIRRWQKSERGAVREEATAGGCLRPCELLLPVLTTTWILTKGNWFGFWPQDCESTLPGCFQTPRLWDEAATAGDSDALCHYVHLFSRSGVLFRTSPSFGEGARRHVVMWLENIVIHLRWKVNC